MCLIQRPGCRRLSKAMNTNERYSSYRARLYGGNVREEARRRSVKIHYPVNIRLHCSTRANAVHGLCAARPNAARAFMGPLRRASFITDRSTLAGAAIEETTPPAERGVHRKALFWLHVCSRDARHRALLLPSPGGKERRCLYVCPAYMCAHC